MSCHYIVVFAKRMQNRNKWDETQRKNYKGGQTWNSSLQHQANTPLWFRDVEDNQDHNNKSTNIHKQLPEADLKHPLATSETMIFGREQVKNLWKKRSGEGDGGQRPMLHKGAIGFE